MIVTFYERSKSINGQEISNKSWPELVEYLTTEPDHSDEKDGACFIFGEVKKDAEGNRRHTKTNVVAIHALAIDIDDADEDQSLAAVVALQDRGLEFCGWPTYSQIDSPKKDKLRFRLVFRLSEPVAAKDWPRFWSAAMADLGLTELRDPKCCDASRLYFHTVPRGEIQAFRGMAELLRGEGEPLDVAAILAKAPAAKSTVDLNARELLDGGIKVERCPRSRSVLVHGEELCQTMPAAVSGANGHVALLRITRALRWGLRIGANETASLIKEMYNPRCAPVWSDAEIAHKVTAAEQEDGAPYSQGSLLPPPPDSFEDLPLIVQKQGLYWMRESNSDDFARRCVESDLMVNIRKHFPEELTSTWVEDEKPLTKSVIEKQSSPVLHVETHYYESTTTFEMESETLRQGLRVDPKLRPVFDAEVNDWLSVISGDRLASLQQWIAGTRNDYLRAPSRALALVGQKDTGKSLVAYGLARIWNRPPVDAIALCNKFNGALMNCPVVLADEQIPPELTGEGFRKVIVARTHEVEPKGKERVPLFGAVRMVVAANDVSKLFLAGPKGANDVEAIADRLFVLVIPNSKTKAAYDALQVLKDPKDPSGSGVDLVRLAQHFLYLQQTVTPARGRFIGAPEDKQTETLLLAAETERAPELYDLFREYLADPEGWEEGYRMGASRPVPRRGEVAPEARSNYPIVRRDDRLYVRQAVLGQLIGRELGEVSRACKPFKISNRDTTISVSAGVITVHALDLPKLLAALESSHNNGAT